MLRKFFTWALMFLLIAASVPAAPAEAAAFRDLNGHWAKSFVEELTDLGIYASKSGNFNPDQPITRGEALVLLNRLLKVSFGEVSDPYQKAQIDNRHPLSGEIKQLVGTINMLFYAGQKQYIDFNPGHNMLYYLHLSAAKNSMRDIKAYNSKWWLASNHLQQPLNREEASMVLFHVLSPNIREKLNIPPTEVAARFDEFYQWKEASEYIDTQSSYATVIKDFRVFDGNVRQFQPKGIVTRAQFAVVLKRLYDFYRYEMSQHFQGPPENRLEIVNLFLTAASYSYEKQNKESMKRYFDEKALDTLEKIKPAPLHMYTGDLKLNSEELSNENMTVVGLYESRLLGQYQVEYKLVKDDQAGNPYGWKISSISYVQK
jgi:hypothetical protein